LEQSELADRHPWRRQSGLQDLQDHPGFKSDQVRVQALPSCRHMWIVEGGGVPQ
jgi:hypothetical protein